VVADHLHDRLRKRVEDAVFDPSGADDIEGDAARRERYREVAAPWSASFSAIPRPMPRDPPVMSACLAVMVMMVSPREWLSAFRLPASGALLADR
jgi:hypothetical protein